MNTVSKYLSLVKFAHTIFAMPFAAVGFVYAYATLPAGAHDAAWWLTRAVQVLLCMVFARNTAMGFNRWADRRIDAENPRTAGREIPAGVIPARHALRFVAVNALLFIAAASTINLLTALLSPVALFIILFTANALPRWPIWCWGFRSASRPSGPISPSRGVSPSNPASSRC